MNLAKWMLLLYIIFIMPLMITFVIYNITYMDERLVYIVTAVQAMFIGYVFYKRHMLLDK
jgi:hypothetical protein